MKQKQFLSNRKVYFMAMMACSVLFFGSCADHYDGDETWGSPVRNATLQSPDEAGIMIDSNSDGSQMTISWPVVYGAGGYEFQLFDANDETTPLVSETIDGCKKTVAREEDMNYKIVIRTLGNSKLNNKEAATPTVKLYSTFTESEAKIPVGDLYEYFQANPIPEDKLGQNLYFDLEPGGQYTLSKPLEIGYFQVTLRSVSKTNFATITATEESKAAFVVQNGFTLKYLNLDWTASSAKGLIMFSETPSENVPLNETIWENAATKGSNTIMTPVVMNNCRVRGLKNAVIAVGQNANGWVAVNVSLVNNIIQLDNSNSYFLDFYGSSNKSAFKNLSITNNTIYNLQQNSSQFAIRFSNASNAVKLFGTNSNPEANRFVSQISHNTLINLFTGKDFANNIPNNACFSNILTDNIFFNVYRLQKYILGNQTRTYSNNIIWSDGTTTIDATDKSTYCIEADPGFAAPLEPLDFSLANGGLNLIPSGLAAEQRSGDPRWLSDSE